MDLFNESSRDVNILPYDGIVLYHGVVLGQQKEIALFDTLLKTVPWKSDEVMLFGKRIITKRKVAWYGDQDYRYTYSNMEKRAIPWSKELLVIKNLVEHETKERFNSCLLNLYHDGGEGMGWHSDDEKELGEVNTIASVSLGAARKFSFKHKKTKDTTSLMLERGSLLEMKGSTQRHWLHALPKTKKILNPRINLTFRTIISERSRTK
ncbi:alpha-ketoglutarate-dependent dioxygenase AlkB family protein [Aquimarina hainanensis]|uniref:Alpha-ketoglutarate-dependent dioxygenase AlkB family protein n=1 Tax=Aquimarina hainanensis TaxID=1578017 RepID=A0ABW5N7K9_9FLAO